MAVEKAKVRAMLDTKTAGKNLTPAYKDSIAANYADKIETDEDIENYVSDRVDTIIISSSEIDRARTIASTAKKEEPAQPAQPAVVPAKTESGEDVPAYMKAFMEQQAAQLAELKGQLAQQTAEKTQATLAERFTKDERMAGIPVSLALKFAPKTEAEFEAAVTDATTTLADYIPAFVGARASDAPIGVAGAPRPKTQTVKEPTDDEIKRIGAML